MLFKLSLDTNTTFVKTFTFDAKQSRIIILDNELSNMTINIPVSEIDAVMMSKIFNTLTHQLMEDAVASGKGYVYINLRAFISNYEAALVQNRGYKNKTQRKTFEL